jgi:hypothetical protein
MPLPLAPIAGFALRYGVVAVAAYAASRRLERGHFDQRAEDAMDDVNEGVTYRREREQMNSTARFRRVVRVGKDGSGLEIDITALGRVRIRKV